MSDEMDGKHGVQSLEIGMGILRAIVNGQRAMMLKDIAVAAEMPPSKAHRYLVSLIRSGFVEQDPITSRYDLGPAALNVGLVAIDRLDRVRLGLTAIAQLRDQINETTALAVWGETGPIIVRWERPRRPITVNVVTGTALELLTSASGRVFAAWLANDAVDRQIAKELKKPDLPPNLKTRADVDRLLAQVRADGYAAISDYYLVNGVEAVAAPVFNFRNEITMSMLAVGVKGMFDMSPGSMVVTGVTKAAAELSVRLGYTGAEKKA